VPCALHTREYHGASAGPAAQDATARAPRLSCSPAEGQRPHRVWKDLQPIVMAFSDGSRGAFCAQGSTWRAREHRRKVSGIFFSTTEPIQAFDQEKKCAHPPDFRLGPLTFVVSHRSGGPARRWASLLRGCHHQFTKIPKTSNQPGEAKIRNAGFPRISRGPKNDQKP